MTARANRPIDHFLDVLYTEFRDLPGLHLTKPQLCRLLGVDSETCDDVLGRLEREHFLQHTSQDDYVLDRGETRQRDVHGSC